VVGKAKYYVRSIAILSIIAGISGFVWYYVWSNGLFREYLCLMIGIIIGIVTTDRSVSLLDLGIVFLVLPGLVVYHLLFGYKEYSYSIKRWLFYRKLGAKDDFDLMENVKEVLRKEFESCDVIIKGAHVSDIENIDDNSRKLGLYVIIDHNTIECLEEKGVEWEEKARKAISREFGLPEDVIDVCSSDYDDWDD